MTTKQEEDRKRKHILHLEGIIVRQKHNLEQLNNIVKETRFLLKSKKQEAYSDISEIHNNLLDDLTMDKDGEYGYKTEKEVIKAIKKYTLKLLTRKGNKWKKLIGEKNV